MARCRAAHPVALFSRGLGEDGCEHGGGNLGGVAVDPKGTPVANASVRLVNAGAVVVKETKSDGQGEFTLEGIAAGEYQLTAEAEGFVKVIADVAVAGVEAREVLQFRQLAPLTSRLRWWRRNRLCLRRIPRRARSFTTRC